MARTILSIADFEANASARHPSDHPGDVTRSSPGGNFAACLAGLVLLLLGSPAAAGLAPCEVVVVVNSGSFNSRTLANHYVALRRIPAINVIELSEVPNSETISVNDFREKILKPLVAELDRRKLSTHVQCIAYSADFPTAIDLREDLKAVPNLPKVFTPVGSLNGLTYLYARVLAADPTYIHLNANFYARRELETYFSNPAGNLTDERWKEIEQLRADGQHGPAADALAALFAEQPHQFPIAYLAAAEASSAGDASRAIDLLQQAVSAGWNIGSYLAKDERFDALRDDPDFQLLELLLDPTVHRWQPASGFDARKAWAPNGVPVLDSKFGYRYMLSCVLGVTRGGGTTLAEAIAALQRSASADFTHPQGGFYFCLTSDVRTTTRKWSFLGAVDVLSAMGHEAEIVQAPLPRNKPSVLGVQLGAPVFNWSSSGSTLVPGAIADNLTSLGGVMTSPAGQTKLTELIKAGAAASSGTVTEPYALEEKFPHPQLYAHYAAGASLIEAFYLSVTGPYQLLIVGDPLCRPFSNAPQPQFDRGLRLLAEGDSLQFEIDTSGPDYNQWLEDKAPVATRTQPLAPAAVSMLLDGNTPQSALVRPRLNVQLRGQSPGYHELTLRFAADDPLSQRSDVTIPIWIGEPGTLDLELVNGERPTEGSPPTVSLESDEYAQVRVTSPDAQRLTIWHDAEQIAKGASAEGASEEKFMIPLGQLGLGPVRIRAQVELAGGEMIHSQPLWIEVEP